MRISMIAALGEKTRVIGKEDSLLWNLKEDMARFKSLTSGHPVIMGRKTYLSIPEQFRPLARRTNIVLSRSDDLAEPGVSHAKSLEQALDIAQRSPGNDEVFVMGGGEIYLLAIALAHRLYLTVVRNDPEGDTFFPEYAGDFTKVLENERKFEGPYTYTFLTLERG